MEDYGHSNYQLFLSGDIKGFENVVSYYRNNLVLFIEQYVHDFATAEDVAQDVFVKLYLKKPHYQRKASFKTWLYTIAKREAINFVKKQKRHAEIDEGRAASDGQLVDEIIANEEKRELYLALESLNVDYRRVLYLRYFEDLSVADIAKLLGKKPKQITDMLYNAKKSLLGVMKMGGNMYEDY